MARDCTTIQAEIDALEARLKQIGLGNSIEESQYGPNRVKFSQANPAEIRRQIAELEDEARAANCTLTRAKGGGAIRPAL